MPNILAPQGRCSQTPSVLVLGGTGKTGHRIVDRLTAKGVPTRVGSRRGAIPFDWGSPSGWSAALDAMEVAYVNYAPDLAIPGAPETIADFVESARAAGLRRLVLLSGRGEAGAETCERIVLSSGLEATVVRASWFNQNFTEGAFLPMVQGGTIALPAGDIPEPFIDADDIADVAVAAMTEPDWVGEVLEVTGPRAMTFAEIAREIVRASGRSINFVQISHDAFLEDVSRCGAPKDVVWLLDYLFSTVLDGRNVGLGDGVQRVLGRDPKDFSTFACEAAVTGIWSQAASKIL
ncbi:SDR family oxidoreductase [Rhodospirillum sp. A1_3_36]|uniref:SDR family oxidoreductase n=1 Tax=Rhodospirillum sp. A1_3_36 TaxID=3391666 RepID=UPI0039A7423E